MNIKITTFVNPFSIFCTSEDDGIDLHLLENKLGTNNTRTNFIMDISDVHHGQYVAVMIKNKWTRGIIDMESQFLIWLIDYGVHLHPNKNTIYLNLPSEYKKYPSKVFEASIHGVTPICKELTHDCRLQNKSSTVWSEGSVEKAKELIASAVSVYFVPIAILSTKNNDVVLGDLYLDIPMRGVINIVDEMQLWPVYLEKNKEAYIKNLSAFYINRRRHYASITKPIISEVNLPNMSLQTTLAEYQVICANAPKYKILNQSSNMSEDGSTVVEVLNKKNYYKLSPAEMEKYSNMYVMINGQEFNALNILLNKIRDLKMCERYKDHDLKSVGRGSTCRLSKKLSK